MRVTKNTIISDIVDRDEGCADIFAAFGMHCVNCPSSRGETVEEACELHEIDCDELLTRLNARLAE